MPDHQNMTMQTPEPKPPRKGRGLLWALLIIVLLLFAATAFNLCADRGYITKSKLSKVVSALDPVKQALIHTYKEKGTLPRVTTVVTQANQGKAVTPDWAALGFDTLPFLPIEVSSLSISGDGEIVVVFANVSEAIDNTEVRAIAMKEVLKQGSRWAWEYKCTSESTVLRKFFHCG